MRKRWGKAISYLLNPRDEHLQALEMALRSSATYLKVWKRQRRRIFPIYSRTESNLTSAHKSAPNPFLLSSIFVCKVFFARFLFLAGEPDMSKGVFQLVASIHCRRQ